MFELLEAQYGLVESDDLAVLLGGMNPIYDDQRTADAAMMFDWLNVLGDANATTEITDEQWRQAVLRFLHEKEKSMGLALSSVISGIALSKDFRSGLD
ncbi:MAG: hypothetical protein WAU70_16660 [Flavobacteriales bacterium]